jgi:hypothetical protein
MRHALAEFRSERYLRVKGGAAPSYGTRSRGCTRAATAAGSAAYEFSASPGWRAALLHCAHEKDAVRAALAKWKAEDFEAASDAGMVVAAMRTYDEWQAHPQAQALRGLPPVIIEKIGEAPPSLCPNCRPMPKSMSMPAR